MQSTFLNSAVYDNHTIHYDWPQVVCVQISQLIVCLADPRATQENHL